MEGGTGRHMDGRRDKRPDHIIGHGDNPRPARVCRRPKVNRQPAARRVEVRADMEAFPAVPFRSVSDNGYAKPHTTSHPGLVRNRPAVRYPQVMVPHPRAAGWCLPTTTGRRAAPGPDPRPPPDARGVLCRTGVARPGGGWSSWAVGARRIFRVRTRGVDAAAITSLRRRCMNRPPGQGAARYQGAPRPATWMCASVSQCGGLANLSSRNG